MTYIKGKLLLRSSEFQSDNFNFYFAKLLKTAPVKAKVSCT